MTTINKYKAPIKRVAKHCAYTGEEFNKNDIATIEHIKPRAAYGNNDIGNCLVVKSSINNLRGNMDFKIWLKKRPDIINHIKNYLNEVKNVITS